MPVLHCLCVSLCLRCSQMNPQAVCDPVVDVATGQASVVICIAYEAYYALSLVSTMTSGLSFLSAIVLILAARVVERSHSMVHSIVNSTKQDDSNNSNLCSTNDFKTLRQCIVPSFRQFDFWQTTSKLHFHISIHIKKIPS